MTGDRLLSDLLAAGTPHDQADAIVERAAILQYDAGRTRWYAGVTAQKQVLGRVVVNHSDI